MVEAGTSGASISPANFDGGFDQGFEEPVSKCMLGKWLSDHPEKVRHALQRAA